MYYGYGSYFWLMIPVMILAWYAQSQVKTNYNKYAKVRNTRGLTGYQVAEQILRSNGLYDVSIEKGHGTMTDHYDPRSKKVVLSPHVHDANSISAASIAAHECGHAVQHATGYVPLSFRSLLAKPAQFASKAAFGLIFVGFILARSGLGFLIDAGIIAYCVIALFQIVTLPVEFNASSRAIKMMGEYGLLYEEDMDGTKRVLRAAALTYVAATLSSIMTIVRLLLIRNNRR